MGAVGNSCFHLAFKNPLENGVVLMKNKSSCKFMVPSNSFKVKRISCKLSESGVEKSPSSNRASNSKNRMEDYNTIMKKMMRNPYEYHHDLGQFLHFLFPCFLTFLTFCPIKISLDSPLSIELESLSWLR